jgi:hypothetical protein
MDLGTVTPFSVYLRSKIMVRVKVSKRLESSSKPYRKPEDAAADIRLVWTNAMLYNAPGVLSVYMLYVCLIEPHREQNISDGQEFRRLLGVTVVSGDERGP